MKKKKNKQRTALFQLINVPTLDLRDFLLVIYFHNLDNYQKVIKGIIQTIFILE